MPREDATEVLVDKVAVPKGTHSTVHRPVRHRFGAGSPRGDGSGALVGRGAVPKTGQKTPSPRGDATEIPVDRGAVPKTGQKNSLARDNLYLMGAALFPCAREHTPL